jgi:hypothetical protein
LPRTSPNLAAYLGLSLVIFLLLMAVYWLFIGKPRNKVDISTSYAALITALGSQNLLPPVGDDTMLSSLAGMTLDVRKIRMPQGGSVGLTDMGLGEVLTARVMDAQVFRVELNPQFWRELQPGPLREALRQIARSPLAQQQSSPAAIHAQQSSPVFSFQETFGGQTYDVTPVFDNTDCVMLTISQAK